ncbi:MAG: type II toxin-antitoxin system VapC family toxin [Chloroflexi bacterium]|nr:type II toxin-antitoxin system VapC family toxin [Chloroflexota bacterium]
MKLLLDTHAFLWFISGDSQLSSYARQLIEDSDNQRYLSVTSIWEITIKSSLGRLEVPTPPSKLIREYVWANAIELLTITSEHLDVVHTLPYHHKDPFDRLMIAQAIHEDMVLISRDVTLNAYSIRIEWTGRK